MFADCIKSRTLILSLCLASLSAFTPAGGRRDDYLAGYLIVPIKDKAPKDMYSDIEGGLGWWRDTRFPTETPKFIMGGVGPNFSNIANGPAHGWGTWEEPRGLYGVAQLSPWVLFPIDGLNVKQGTNGELFGYGYLNLPLCQPKARTKGQDIPTGGNTWTLFLNTENFKGPLAFFLPHFFSQSVVKQPALAGQLLDTRPSDPNRHVQMETQYIPCRLATDAKGEQYARIAPTQFPHDPSGKSILLHQDTVYSHTALWDTVDAWFKGGPPATGSIDVKGAFRRPYTSGGSSSWQIHSPGEGNKETKTSIAWPSFAKPFAIDEETYGYQFSSTTLSQNGKLQTIPEYFHLERGKDPKQDKWVPVPQTEVPTETHLQEIQWSRPEEKPEDPYLTPTKPTSSFKKPGPVAGPFKAHLGDGSVVTYYWYRFADQPALLNADLSDSEREEMQRKVEKIHRTWTKSKQYLAPPKFGKLASLDPAQIVKPPKSYEIGYVPIATKQELEKK